MEGKEEVVLGKDLDVGGFIFLNIEDANIARGEIETIEYLDTKLVGTHPESKLKIYNKILDDKLFITPIGWNYLHRLQKRLVEEGIEQARIISLPLERSYSVKETLPPAETSDDKNIKIKIERLQAYVKKLTIVIATLIIILIAMFVITMRGTNPNIINYENAIVNKYAQWEDELMEREKIIRAKEREFNINE